MEITKKLTCAAMVFYEYKADNGAILKEAANRIKELEDIISKIEIKVSGGLCCFTAEGKHEFLKDVSKLIEK